MGKAFWFDVETTGINPEKCAIIQLAGIIEIGGKPVEEIEIKMKPFDGADVNMEALAVNNMTLEQVMGYEPWEKGMKKLIKIFDQYVERYDKNDKMILMGYRVDFDSSFLRYYFKRLGGDTAKFGYGSRFFNAPVDVMSLVAMLVLDENVRLANFKLKTVCEFLGIELDAHDALNDIRATRQAYQILRKKLSANGNHSEKNAKPKLAVSNGSKPSSLDKQSAITQTRMF